MSAELESLIESAAVEAIEAYKSSQRANRNKLVRGTPELRAYNNEYQREWRRVRIEVDPAYREIEMARFRQQYKENPAEWRRARVERENARAKTPAAREHARAYINTRRANDPEFRERERERDRKRYASKKGSSNV